MANHFHEMISYVKKSFKTLAPQLKFFSRIEFFVDIFVQSCWEPN